ncbi:MAG: sialidase family protein [Actinomycetes bacterium]
MRTRTFASPRALLSLGIAGLTAAAVLPALATGATHHDVASVVNCPSVAVAHYAGQTLLNPQPDNLPLACGGTTGFAGAESHVVALPSGDVVVTPAVVPSGFLGIDTPPVSFEKNTQSNASPAGIAITRDQGEHWSFVRPSGVTWNPTDHGDYVDPTTGRLFFEDYGPIPVAPKFGSDQEGPAHINWSGDGGTTWHHTAIRTVFLPENPRFASGVAPVGQPKPTGYPNVMYFCANTNVGFTAPAIAGRLCFRSLNGGTKWQRGAVLFTGLVPQHPECGPHGEQYTAIDGNYPQSTRNGYLYVMVSCGGTTYLARSTDEAKSFPVLHVDGAPLTLPVPPGGGIGGGADFRIGPDDTMYLMYQTGSALMLRVSNDLGLTWSPEYNVVAPGVTAISKWAFTSGDTGQVAVAYLGQRAGQTTWDGYLTETLDAGSALTSGPGPVFFSGQVNSPSRPLLYGDGIQGSGYIGLPKDHNAPFPPPFNNQSTGNDFIGSTIASNADAFGSFTQDCGPSPKSAGCRAQNDQTRGYVGFFRWPPGLPHTG